MKAVLLAAGKGSRLGKITKRLPKPMLRIDGEPVLERNLELCKKHGIKRVCINLHHNPTAIEDYFGNGSKWGVRISYRRERSLLGTAGAVKNFQSELRDEPFFVLYGDNGIPYDLSRIKREHARRGADMTIAVFKKKDVRSSGVVRFNQDGRITTFVEKPRGARKNKTGWVNAGVYLMNPRLLADLPPGASDFGRDVIPLLLRKKRKLFAAPMTQKVTAIDTPKLLHRWTTKKQRAVFVDRDGVLNQAVIKNGRPFAPRSLSHMKIIPGVPAVLRALHEKGVLLIVATNQPDVGRGTQTLKSVEDINCFLRRTLFLDDIRVCYKDGNAWCKKPNPGMLLEAARDWNIDLKRSFMVGDRWKDIEAGRRAGCRTVFVDYHYDDPGPLRPTHKVRSSPEALRWILRRL